MKQQDRELRAKIGDRVLADDRAATVIHHGRDRMGPYSRVRFDDGTEEEYHRSQLHLICSGCRVLGLHEHRCMDRACQCGEPFCQEWRGVSPGFERMEER